MSGSKTPTIIAITALAVDVLFATPLGQAASRLVLPKNSVGAVQLKKSSVAGKKIAKNAVTSPKVKDGSLLAADFKAGQLPRGPQGPKGDPGPQGIQGQQGPAGPYPNLLPSGKTVRGAYTISDTALNAGNTATTAISFGFQLSSAPTAHYIVPGGANANCPGTAAAPQANPGHLCVYEGYRANILTGGFLDPLDWVGGTIRPWGTQLWFSAAGAGNFRIAGSWAVTAP